MVFVPVSIYDGDGFVVHYEFGVTTNIHSAFEVVDFVKYISGTTNDYTHIALYVGSIIECTTALVHLAHSDIVDDFVYDGGKIIMALIPKQIFDEDNVDYLNDVAAKCIA